MTRKKPKRKPRRIYVPEQNGLLIHAWASRTKQLAAYYSPAARVVTFEEVVPKRAR